MRIAYVCADGGVPVFGCKGCSIHVQEVVRAFCRLGHAVDLFTPRGEGIRPPGLEAVTVHALPSARSPEPAVREQVALAANTALRAALERHGPFELIYERYSLWSYAGMQYAQEHSVPGLLEVNAPLIEEQAEHRTLVDRTSAEEVARRVFQAATGLLAVSEEVAAYLQQNVATFGRVHVVPNGVNTERFRPVLPPLLQRDSTSFTVGFVGSLKPWHGLSVLVEAFDRLHKRHPDSRLVIIGEGPERPRVLENLMDRGLSGAFHLTGAIPPDQVPSLLTSLDVAVAPYTQRDGFYFSPLKVYEYMAAGLPVVASKVGQLADLIVPGVNGLLCPPGDPVALAASLELLRGDAALRRLLGQKARRTVVGKHTWEAVVRSILDLARCSARPVLHEMRRELA
jgi:glycosyltransferase involved in cell wall biosynthesis